MTSILDLIHTEEDYKPAEHLKVLPYGPPGAGKTQLAMTAPLPFALVFGPRNELDCVRGAPFLNRYGAIKYKWASVEEQAIKRGVWDKPEAFDLACDILDKALEMDRKGATPDGEDFHFETLVIDNASVAYEYAMHKAMQASYDLAGDKQRTSLNKLKTQGIRALQEGDWGLQMSVIDQFMDWIYKIPKHLVFVAHVWHDYKVVKGVTVADERKPLFTGKHREYIPRYFDNVWYLSKSGKGKSAQYQTLTQGTEKVYAKTRLGGILKDEEYDLDLTSAFKRLKTGAEELWRKEKEKQELEYAKHAAMAAS